MKRSLQEQMMGSGRSQQEGSRVEIVLNAMQWVHWTIIVDIVASQERQALFQEGLCPHWSHQCCIESKVCAQWAQGDSEDQ